jgi:hypothetical protein
MDGTLRTSSRTRTIGSAARSTRAGLTALGLAASLAIAGCSGGSGDTGAGGQGPDAQNTAAGSTLMGQWPLTGEPANGPRPKHPVMVVKIDNTESSRPQVGLSKADLVTEELVEGGATRLAVFYYSKVPKVVGPVRSFRASDIGVVKPVHGVLVASGGAPPTVRRIKQAGIKTVTEGGTGFYRDSGRSAPYNLFMNLPKLASTLTSHHTPDNYLPWGEQGALPSGRRAKGLAAQFSGGHTTSWRYKGGSYVNLNSNAASGDQFRPDTVLVLRVRVGDAGYLDPAGNPVPEMHFTGKGDAMVFHGGRMVRGTWSKKGYAAPIDLRSKQGELHVPAGNVWIELVPAKTGSVTITR